MSHTNLSNNSKVFIYPIRRCEMCIPHYNNAPRQYEENKKRKKAHKSIPLNKELMKPDPDFIDERKIEAPKEKS